MFDGVHRGSSPWPTPCPTPVFAYTPSRLVLRTLVRPGQTPPLIRDIAYRMPFQSDSSRSLSEGWIFAQAPPQRLTYKLTTNMRLSLTTYYSDRLPPTRFSTEYTVTRLQPAHSRN